MIKKIVIFLSILFILFAGLNLYLQKRYQTVECWWGVMYPSLSFIALEDEETTAKKPVRYSSLTNDQLYIAQEKEIPIKYDFAIIKWLKEKFSF